MPTALERLAAPPPATMDVEAGGQLLVLCRPGMSATNEILAILLAAPGTREIVTKITAEIQGHVEAAQRIVDDALRLRLATSTTEDDREIAKRSAARMRVEVALEAGADFASRTMTTLAGSLFDLILPVIRDHGGLGIAAIALDNRDNRRSLAKDATIAEDFGDPKKLAEVSNPGIPPEVRGLYSPALRRWALSEVDGAQAANIAIQALRMLFFSGAMGKAAGTQSEVSAPSVPPTETPTSHPTTEETLLPG